MMLILLAITYVRTGKNCCASFLILPLMAWYFVISDTQTTMPNFVNPWYSKTKMQAGKGLYSDTKNIVSPTFNPANNDAVLFRHAGNTPRPVYAMVVMFVIVI
ncbi:hypothetical protein SNK04_009699 [Fusarium graminearum]